MNRIETQCMTGNPSRLRWAGLIAVLALTVTLGITSTSFAADAGDGESASVGTVSRIFDHFVIRGGYITWLILIPMSLATIALIVEHCISIRRERVLPTLTLERIDEHLGGRRFVEAVRYTESDPSTLSIAVNRGLRQADHGYAAMQGAMLDAIDQEANRMMRKIEYLNVIGNVSPMVGLFGTVYGMIRLFASIREAGGIPEPATIANDISIALVTTFWGLMVAIPALSLFAFFRNRIDALTTDCANTAEQLMSVFEPGTISQGVRPVSTAPPISTPVVS